MLSGVIVPSATSPTIDRGTAPYASVPYDHTSTDISFSPFAGSTNHSTISNEEDPRVREAGEAFAALRVLDDDDDDNDDNDETNNDTEKDIPNENGETNDTLEDEERRFLRALEDIEPEPLEGLSPIGDDDENENEINSLELFGSDIIEFLANGDGFGFGVDESIDSDWGVFPNEPGVQGDIHPNTTWNPDTTAANQAALVSDNEEDPPLLVPESQAEKSDEPRTVLDTNSNTNSNSNSNTNTNTPNTTVTSATTAAASAETKDSVLPELELDFGTDPFLEDPDQLHAIFDTGSDTDHRFGPFGEEGNPDETAGCCADCDCGVGESAGESEEREGDGAEGPNTDEIFPIPAESVLDIDLETEELYRELAKMSLAGEATSGSAGGNPGGTTRNSNSNNSNSNSNNSNYIDDLLSAMQPGPRTARDILMEPTIDDVLGTGSEPPFSYLTCQPCSPGDATAAAASGSNATTNPASTPPSDADAPTTLELLMDPTLSSNPSANGSARNPTPGATNPASTQSSDADVPTTMELLMDPTLNFDMDDAVGSDGLPFYMMCQPCDPRSANALFGGLGNGNGNGSSNGAGTGMDNSGSNLAASSAYWGAPFPAPSGGLAPISEDQAMTNNGEDGSGMVERDKEQYVRDLKALYAQSGATKRRREGDDLTPLDHNVYGDMDGGNPPMSDDFHQLALQLQREQEEREYREWFRDATHWAEAFGARPNGGAERTEGESRAKKAPSGDTSKSGLGHKEVIYGISFSEDGKYVATASQDSTVCIWDVATHRLLSTLKGHDTKYECLRVDWASRAWAEEALDRSVLFANLIVSGGADGTVKVWACKDRDDRDDNGLRIIDNQWECQYTLDHASLLSKGTNAEKSAGEKERAPDDENETAGDSGENEKPQIYSLQFIDDWRVFNKELLEQQQQCSRHAKAKEAQRDNQDPVANSFLMTSSDEFIHLWEVEPHSMDQQLALNGQKVRILQEKIKLREVMSLHFGPLAEHGYGVTACSITGEGLKLPPPPTKKKKNAAPRDGSTPFGGDRNPDNTIFVFDAAYSPGSGLLGVALADGSLRLVNGRGICISVINLPGNRSHLTSFCWDATGNRLATCVGTGHLITWSLDPDSHKGGNYNTVAACTAIFEGGHQSGRPLFGSRFCGGDDENLLLSWGVDGKLCLWYSKARGNIYDPVAILRDDASYPVFAVELSPSEDHAVVGGGSDGGFIGVPLHFYGIPPLADNRAEVTELSDDPNEKKEVSQVT